MFIGLTGTKASGKGEIAKILEKKGFEYSSLSDRVREEAVARGLENYTIKDLQDIGNELREKYGLSVWADKSVKKAKNQNVVFDGIRNLGEIEFFRKYNDFILIGVDADQEKRYKFLVKRGRSSDPKSLKGFLKMEKRDLGFGEENIGQQVGHCLSKADYLFFNELVDIPSLVYDFTEGKENFMGLISENKRRPSFDEQFMKDALHWSNRSTCLRRETGAVIAKENRFISEGYNGSPRGSPHCKDLGGCLREKMKIPSGERDDLCRAVHAEANAILNASLREDRKDSVIYTTTYPCTGCARLIANSGIKEVQYLDFYNSSKTKEILKDAKVKLKRFTGVTPQAYSKFWK